jgi:hypothetical protein
MPVEITCKVCGKKKMITPYQVNKINGNCCSRSCLAKSRTGEKNSFYGKKHSEDSKDKIRISRGDMSGENNPFFGLQHTKKSKRMIALKQEKNFEDPEYQKKFHDSRVEMWKDPTYRENKIDSMIGVPLSEETKQKIGDAQRKCWENEEYRNHLVSKRKETWEDPEYRIKKSNIMKKLWESEEYRNNVLTPLRNIIRSPAYREKMSILMSGDKTHLWKGGISDQPYHKTFNREFRERVREFFGRRCFDCGMDEKENGAKLSVHHIDEDKSMCGDGSELSYVPLCVSCHRFFHVGDNNITKKKEYVDKLIDIYNGKCYYTKEEFYKN